MESSDRWVCVRREGAMPEGASIPRHPWSLTSRRIKIGAAIAVVSAIAGYMLTTWTQRYAFHMGPGAIVARVDRSSGEVAFCRFYEPCMTAEARAESAERKARAEDAATHQAVAEVQPAAPAELDLSGLIPLDEATTDATSAEREGRDLFEEAGIAPTK